MALSDERQQVLRMVESNNVSPRDGARLLLALGELGDEEPLSGEPQQVLGMIEEAKISVEDGARLLIALGGLRDQEPSHDRTVSPASPVPSDDGALVFVTVTSKDGKAVRLAIPLEGARMVLPLFDLPHAALLGEHGRDISRIQAALRSGEPGEVMDYHDEESGHSVHIAIG